MNAYFVAITCIVGTWICIRQYPESCNLFSIVTQERELSMEMILTWDLFGKKEINKKTKDKISLQTTTVKTTIIPT